MNAPHPAPFRYRCLGYAALNVSDLDRSLAFYRDLVGLTMVAQEGDTVFLRCSRDHHNLILCRSVTPGLKRVGFQLESAAEVDVAFAHFARAGLEPAWISGDEAAGLKQGPTFRVRERHSGVLFEYFSTITQMAAPFVPTVASIARIGHIVIGSADYPATRSALLDTFNFRISDFVEGRIAFLRGFPNPYHHTFAVGASASGKSHLHHVNFMVTDIDDVGRALHRMTKAGVKIVFGPGRHPPSGSVFLYFLDPDGMTVEYSFGMEEFPEHQPREPRMLEPVPASMDTWGAVPDRQFAIGGAIEVTE